MTIIIICMYCGQETEAQRMTKKFCSDMCARRYARGWSNKRNCRECGSEFEVRDRSDANRQHCSRQCAKRHNTKRVRAWTADHPETEKIYRDNQLAKDPDYNKKQKSRQRSDILKLLGGACIVCGATNPSWLHVDFIPTSRGLRYRHARHFKYVSDNLELFRILCANHHYELTLTGHIEGTDIVQ